MKRACELVEGEVYHVMNKSIAGFVIFQSDFDYIRFVRMMRFYLYKNTPGKFSQFIESLHAKSDGFEKAFKEAMPSDAAPMVDIIAYCLMPTHIHIVAKPLTKNGLSLFMGNLLNSYTRYFNIKSHRKGPLWQGKFHSVLVDDTDQLLHLTRYLHLNPTSAGLVKKAGEWSYSSYKEYLGQTDPSKNICSLKDLSTLIDSRYENFVNDHTDYQKNLAILKKHIS